MLRRRLLASLVLTMVLPGCYGGSAASQSSSPSTSSPPPTSGSHPASAARTLRLQPVGRLPLPLQDAAVTTLGSVVYAFGGLDAAQGSVGNVIRIGDASRTVSTLPVAIHDAAATTLDGRMYVLGGGQVQSYAGIGWYEPGRGISMVAATLPTPLSDLAVARVGGTAYAVGGYTGSAFSHAVVAFDGHRTRVVGRLPVGLRYAAVATVGGNVLIAGGRTTSGPSSAIYRFTPATGTVARIGTLPTPVMHAGGGAIGSTMYVIGGLGPSGAPTDRIVAVSANGRARALALRLARPLSDAGVASLPGRLVIVGGNDGSGPVAAVETLRWTAPAPPSTRHRHRTAGAQAAMFRGPLPGDLLIADRGNDRLLIVNPRHKIVWRFPRRPGQIHLNFDDDAFFTAGGRGIISNEEEHHTIVQIAFPSGRLIWHYGHPGVPGSGPGYLNTPDDAYRLANGMVIVADVLNCRVLEILGHRIVRMIGTTGVCSHDPPHAIASPNGDTPLPDGHILISEITGSWIDEVTMKGRLVRAFQAPVVYPSDPQLTRFGNIILADYARPGGVVILNRRTGRELWRYQPTSGPGMLDHPSLAETLPNGDIIVGDDFNDRIVIIDPHTKRIVWQYGHTGVGGTRPGYLHIPDGFDFIPATPGGKLDYAAILHGPPR